MKKSKYKPISKKINTIISVTLILGVGIVIFILFRSLYTTIDMDTKKNIEQQSEILHTSIKNFMLPGQAPLAVKLLSDLEEANPYFTIKLYRSDGTYAFTDNKTIMQVNKNLKKEVFKERDDIYTSGVMRDDLPTHISFMDFKVENESFVKVYRPLRNLASCAKCHGSDHIIRGVIEITNNITESENEKKTGIITSVIIFPIIVLALLLILTTFIHKSVLNPIKRIGEVCNSVTKGVFSNRVKINSNDEIGDLGNTVNKMSEGLMERFELSKYVSESTIKSLSGSNDDGEQVNLTLFFSDIRGFTSYSEKHTPREVVRDLNKILNFQTQIIKSEGGDIDKYVGDEIMAIFTGENQEERACNAAIKIQKELKLKSKKEYGNLMVGIGINRGDVILGMLGSQDRADFTVIGDNVNTAARICSAAGKGEVLVKDNIYDELKDKISFNEPIEISVKGKDNKLNVYLIKLF
ncbi:MAG: HAMP domain-containing protein [Spirochaetaceae bacterium]